MNRLHNTHLIPEKRLVLKPGPLTAAIPIKQSTSSEATTTEAALLNIVSKLDWQLQAEHDKLKHSFETNKGKIVNFEQEKEE